MSPPWVGHVVSDNAHILLAQFAGIRAGDVVWVAVAIANQEEDVAMHRGAATIQQKVHPGRIDVRDVAQIEDDTIDRLPCDQCVKPQPQWIYGAKEDDPVRTDDGAVAVQTCKDGAGVGLATAALALSPEQ